MPSKQSVNVEMSLNLDQIYYACDEAMSVYHRCCVSDIKHVIESPFVIPTVASERKGSTLKNTVETDLKRKSARKTKKSIQQTDQGEEEENRPAESGTAVTRPERHDSKINLQSLRLINISFLCISFLMFIFHI